MKKVFMAFSLIMVSILSFAQAQEKTVDVKYRRSSLHTMVIESAKFPKKEVVLNAFKNAPFPDKYNDHTIGDKSFNPANYKLTAEEKAEIYKPSKIGGLLATAEIKTDSVQKEMPYRIQKYFSKEKIANKLVGKWYNEQADGSFDIKLISDRGIFNASYNDLKTANASSDGLNLVKVAGLELIGNTFVVVNQFKYYANEPVAAALRDAGKLQLTKSGKPQFIVDKASKLLDIAYEKGKEGYTILATSYLYKLKWNDTISIEFDKQMYKAKNKEAFDNSDLFKLEFVGDESAFALVTFSLKETRTEDQVITLATTRIIDNVYAKLQQKYDVFKTKTPLYTGYPITAKIGVKEGLQGGEKFEVLEQSIDPKTGVATYKRIGKIKVDKKLIWDNSFNMGDAPKAEPVADGKEAIPVIDRTTFNGGKKYYSGLLIRQIM